MRTSIVVGSALSLGVCALELAPKRELMRKAQAVVDEAQQDYLKLLDEYEKIFDEEVLESDPTWFFVVAGIVDNAFKRTEPKSGALTTAKDSFESLLLSWHTSIHPSIHFMLMPDDPITSAEKPYHEQLSVAEITNAVFEPASMSASKMLFSLLRMFSFETVNIGALRKSFLNYAQASGGIQTRIDWSGAFRRIDHKFDHLFAKRAFVHWCVGEGMEEGEFSEAREDLAALDNERVGIETAEGEGEEEGYGDEF